VCTGFSGHGLQHAPAAGLAVSELLGYGFYKTIDLNRFSFDRLIQDNPVLETGIV
jgi:glycine/D-amino acid oxidase-like deaminating enzyme